MKKIFTMAFILLSIKAYTQSTINDYLQINQVNNKYPTIRFKTFEGIQSGGHPSISMQHIGGTESTPLATPANSTLGTLTFMGYSGAADIYNARIFVASTDAFSTGYYPSKMYFKIGGTSTCCGIDRMVIDGVTGNVGIATTSPTAKLDIYDDALGLRIGTSTTDKLHLQHPFTSAAGWKRFVLGGNLWWENNQWNYGAGGSNGFSAVMGRANDGLGFYTKPSSGNVVGSIAAADLDPNYLRMVVAANGRVGIGTSTPDEKLHVKGTTTITGDIGIPTDPHWNTGMHTLELQNNDGGDVVLSFHRAGYSNASIRTSSSMGLIFTGNGAPNAGHLHILKDGQVGIGTSSVGSHRLAVEGSIGAREVKVEATGWSDYVFAPDYTLRSLGEVEQFISENQHLPGIPSAAEVEEQGINVGEMNAKLLEKIEELTLYVIAQDKKHSSQDQKIESLEKQLADMQALLNELMTR